MARYTLPGWPAAVLGHAAAMPQMIRLAASGAMAYKDRVTGEPGTLRIPVKPVIPSPDIGDKAQAGWARSGDAPNYILPQVYYARPEAMFWPGAGMPVSIFSDNLMPVPATDPRGVPSRLSFPPVRRYNRQLQSRPQNVTWPSWAGS